MVTITFGQRIKAWRADRGWTQQELADRAGVLGPTICSVENTTTSDQVAAKTLAGLARAFGCSSETLITGTAAPVPNSAQQNTASADSIHSAPTTSHSHSATNGSGSASSVHPRESADSLPSTDAQSSPRVETPTLGESRTDTPGRGKSRRR